MNNDTFENYLLHEHNKCYDLFQMHYAATSRLFKNYFLVVTGAFGLFSFFYEKINAKGFNIFGLTKEISVGFLILSLMLLLMFCILMEHRIKTIYYVRVLNNIRKYFYDNTSKKNHEYFLLPISKDVPKYFTWFKDFFWELAFVALFNSLLFSISMYNLLGIVKHEMFSFVAIILFMLTVHTLIYSLRGHSQKKQMPKEIDNKKVEDNL